MERSPRKPVAGDLAFLLLLLLSFTETEQGGITNDPETERLATTILIISSFRLPGTWAWLTSRASASGLRSRVSQGQGVRSNCNPLKARLGRTCSQAHLERGCGQDEFCVRCGTDGLAAARAFARSLFSVPCYMGPSVG